MDPFDLVLRLFLQLAVILAACQLVGWIGRRLGQAQVVSEVIAGVVLGPSLLGIVAPELQAWLFPQQTTIAVGESTLAIAHPSMTILYAIAHLGLVLYMFVVGLEFQSEQVHLRRAGLVSGTGIVVPFLLGGLVAVLLHGREGFFPAGVGLGPAVFFLGASMSITAFPVLARILYDKGIAWTRLGTLTLAAGAVGDAIAWCLLALVLASIQASAAIAWMAIGGGVAYVAALVFVGRPLFRGFARRAERDGGITPPTMVAVLLVLMLGAWVTDRIGIYAVFGAFVIGAVMPRGGFAQELASRIGPLTTTLLLPVFFVYSGLHTRIGLVHTPELIAWAALILVVAILGKGLACALAARASGEGWREALTIGALMNARGLMELIILNIGLQEGLITPTLFTMMVLMAVVTTLMTSPLFELLYGRHLERPSSATAVPPHRSLRPQPPPSA